MLIIVFNQINETVKKYRMVELKITTHIDPSGIATISLKGMLDAYSYEPFERALNGLLDNQHYKIVIDLTNLNYISSYGMGLLIGALGIAQQNRGNIILLNPKSSVKDIVELLGMNHIFPIVMDKESAFNSFS